MNIKATNIEDFKKQYYEQFDNKSPFEISIELETDEVFWEELTELPYNNTKQSLNFMGIESPNIKNISQFFIPEYGNVKRKK